MNDRAICLVYKYCYFESIIVYSRGGQRAGRLLPFFTFTLALPVLTIFSQIKLCVCSWFIQLESLIFLMSYLNAIILSRNSGAAIDRIKWLRRQKKARPVNCKAVHTDVMVTILFLYGCACDYLQ